MKFGSKAQRAAVAAAAAAAVTESGPEARDTRNFSRDSDADLISGPRAGGLASASQQLSRLGSVMIPHAGDFISDRQADVAQFMRPMGAAKAVHFGNGEGLQRVGDAQDPSGSGKEGDGFRTRSMESLAEASAESASGAASLHIPPPFGMAGQRAREKCLDRMHLVPTGAGALLFDSRIRVLLQVA